MSVRLVFAEQPELTARLFELLDAVFPGLRERVAELRRLGAAWESVSTAFVRLEDGRPVAHVGVIELPLVLLGRPVSVGSVHAVATHPRHRRRGHYRRLMEEVLEHCDARYETLVLTTENPEYYEPVGFRVLQEHVFRLRCHSPGGAGRLRSLDLSDPGDVELLTRLLETREPVSRVVGVTDAKAVFCFNEMRRPLFYAGDLDALLCMEIEGSTLKLFDVVGPQLPSLDALLATMPRPIDEVVGHFSMDRLAPAAAPRPYVLDHDGPSYLMARGPFAAERRPFTLPRPART